MVVSGDDTFCPEQGLLMMVYLYILSILAIYVGLINKYLSYTCGIYISILVIYVYLFSIFLTKYLSYICVPNNKYLSYICVINNQYPC